MLGFQKPFDWVAESATKTTTAAIVGALLAYVGASVAGLRALHITWWSVVLFSALLTPPILIILALRQANRRLLCRALFLSRKEDDAPYWDHYVRLATVELWEAVLLAFGKNPFDQKFGQAKTGKGGLMSQATGNRNLLGELLQEADRAVGVSLKVVKERDVEKCRLTSLVRLRDFVKWLETTSWEVPTLLRETASLQP